MSEKMDLREIEIFSGLSEDQVEELACCVEIVECDGDRKLFSTGDEANEIYILLEGKVSIQVQLSSRPEKIDVVVLSQKGQLIGWSGLLGEGHYTASGICQGYAKLLKISGKEFKAALELDKEAGFDVLMEIIHVVSGRLRNLQSVVLKTM